MAVMPPLEDNPKLHTLQAWVKEMKAANGWTPKDFRHEAAALVEEVGELMKAHRKSRKDSVLTDSQKSTQDDVGEELADVLIYVMSLANFTEVDIAKALQAKLAKNRNREWTKNA